MLQVETLVDPVAAGTVEGVAEIGIARENGKNDLLLGLDMGLQARERAHRELDLHSTEFLLEVAGRNLEIMVWWACLRVADSCSRHLAPGIEHQVVLASQLKIL